MFEIIFRKKRVVVEIKRSWTEIIIDLAREHTAAFVTIKQAFIVADVIEILVLALFILVLIVIIALICIIKQMYKGIYRHFNKKNKHPQSAFQIILQPQTINREVTWKILEVRSIIIQ